MLIRSNHSLHYPITVETLLATQNGSVDRFAPLFSYTYTSTVTEGNKYGDEVQVEKSFPAEFQSEIDGTLVAWKVKAGDVLERSGIPLVDIEEPCKHEIQFGGLCTNCGRDMTEVDFITTQRNADRATVTMSHENTALKVSQNEAARASEEAKQRLLESRKLSLVVDLDQTIIHATVDPTVAEWQRDSSNPNHEAVKNVRSFQLIDDGPGGRGCWYYIKLRPGLEQFLDEISEKYELHIYTMGTRAYAQNIAKLVDPQQRIFGDRILSRDESGSMVVKNLQRLFPIDTDMVVIIDDRGDVWRWSQNLIKVSPYDFFVGIGDINSSFLPKRADVISESQYAPKLSVEAVADKSTNVTDDATVVDIEGGDARDHNTAVDTVLPDAILPSVSTKQTASDVVTLGTQLVAMAGGDDPSLLEQQSNAQAEAIAVQVEDRPLARKQEILNMLDEEEEAKDHNGDEHKDTASEHEHKHKHNLLHDDDEELRYLQQHLEKMHRLFFEEYDSKLKSVAVGRVSQLRNDKSPKKPRLAGDGSAVVPDVKDIMPNMKAQVLRGVVICFTGVIPQGLNHETSDVGMWARSFGAKISQNLSKSTTHVVAHKDRRTGKVRQAARYPSIHIVTIGWLLQCFTRWAHVDEGPHLIEVERDDQIPQDYLPFDESEDGAVLTPSEAGGNDQMPPNETEHEIVEPVSPSLDKAEWDKVNAELDEFLGSDADDSDMDSELDDGTESDASTQSISPTKRKRGPETANGGGGEDSEKGSGALMGSELQKRKRRALDRTTGLANVAIAEDSSGLPSPDTTGPEEDVGSASQVQKTNGNNADEDGDEDDFNKAFMDEWEPDED